jgi:hypothetical protein
VRVWSFDALLSQGEKLVLVNQTLGDKTTRM